MRQSTSLGRPFGATFLALLVLTVVVAAVPSWGRSLGPPHAVSVGTVEDAAAAAPPMASSANRPRTVAPVLAAELLAPPDEAELEARLLRVGAERLGVPVDEVHLFARESFVVPGDPSRWVGGKVLHDATGKAVVVAARVATGEIVDGPRLEARIEAATLARARSI